MKKVKGTLLRVSYRVPGGLLLDPKDLSRFVHTALANDSFANYLHGTYQPPPFRLKYVQRRSSELVMYLTFLTEESYKIFIAQITDWGSLKIGNISCALKQWEAICSEDLPTNWCSEFENRSITLEFSTPTFFQEGPMPLPLPMPRLVWGSLVKTFETYTHIRLPEGIKNDIEKHVAIQQMQIGTEIASFSSTGKITGFVGQVGFKINSEAPIHVPQILSMLSKWAEFSGVGAKTTYGMGSVRIINDQELFQAVK